MRKDFVFVYGVVPAAGHCVNAEGQCGTGVLVWKRLFFSASGRPIQQDTVQTLMDGAHGSRGCRAGFSQTQIPWPQP